MPRDLVAELKDRPPRDLANEGSGFSFVEMFKNVPGDARRVAGGVVDAASQPVDTAQNIGSVLMGFAQKAQDVMKSKTPKEGKIWELSDFIAKVYTGIANTMLGNEFDAENQPKADQFMQYYVDKYGSVDQALDSMQNTPVETVLDGLSAFSAGSGVLGKARQLAGKAIPEGLPAHMYESAAKFTTTRKDGGANVQALLDEGIPLTRGGVNKLKGLITAINTEIDNILANSPNANTRIPSKFVFSRIDNLKKSYLGTVEGIKDRKIIDRIVEGFKEEIKLTGKDTMTIKELNEWKKSTYGKVTDWSAQKGNKRKTKDEAFKELAAGARDVVERIEPKTKDLNQRQAPLLSSRDGLERAVSRIENRDTLGMGDALKLGMFGGGGTVIGDIVGAKVTGAGLGTLAGALAAGVGRPSTKSKLAIILNNMRHNKPVLPDNVLIDAMIKAGYGNLAYQAGQE